MGLTRFRDWEGRLGQAMAEAVGKAYTPPQFCCSLFAADCILAMTGTDMVSEYRSGSFTKPQIKRLCRDYEGLVVEQCQSLGLEPCGPLYAGRGDLVGMVNANGQFTVGIVSLKGTTFCVPAESGAVQHYPLELATRAWRV